MPIEWAQLKRLVILDPDGWRLDGKALNEPIDEEEFDLRAGRSTITPAGPAGFDPEERIP